MKIASLADFAAIGGRRPVRSGWNALRAGENRRAMVATLPLRLANAPGRDASVARRHTRVRSDESMKHARTLHSPTLAET